MQVSAVNQAGIVTTPTSSGTGQDAPWSPHPGSPFTGAQRLPHSFTGQLEPALRIRQPLLSRAILSSGPNASSNNFANNQSSTTLNAFASFSGLAPNTLYYVDVKTINNSGSSSFAPMGSTPTWANPPGVGTPPVVLSSTQITANWTANGNPTGTQYTAQISQDPGFSTIAGSATTTGTSTTFSGLASNTTYFMQVSAVNQAGIVTTPTTLAPARTLPGAPTPAPFTNVSPTALQANWNPPSESGSLSYQAILSSGPNPNTNNFTGNISSTTANTFALFTSGLNPNTLYFVNVKALNSSGGSGFASLGSTPTWANPPGVGTPPVVLSSTQIAANWTANGNPSGTSYLAQISQDPGFSVIAGSATTTGTSTTFSGLASNTTYFMQVSAVNQAGIVTTPTTLAPARTLPGAPTPAPFTNVSPTALQANWNPPSGSGSLSYQAILSSGPNASSNNFANNQSSTTLNAFASFSGLAPNTLYYVDVKTINNSGSSSFAPMGSTPTWANPPGVGTPPVVLSSTQITANWTANGNPTGTQYTAQISLNQAFTSPTPVITTSTFVTFQGLSSNTTYFMRVLASNQAGVPTTPTTLASARTLPGAPGLLPFTNISPSQIQANWSAPSNGSDNSYLVILSTAPNPSTNGLATNKTASTTNTSVLFNSGLNPNTLYYADVQAINTSGNSAFAQLGSTPTWANVPGAGTPPVVLATQITVNWTANGNPPGTQYLAQISLNQAFTSPVSITTTSLSAVFTGLTPDTTCYLQVSAINQVGIVTAPTPLPTVRTLPGAPGVLPFTNISPSQIQANWSAPSNGSDNSYLAILSTAPNPSTNGLITNKTTSTTNTSALFNSGINPNTLYYVDVQAINNSGPSSFATLGSTPTWANPPGVGTPPVVLSSTQITANWTANGNPSGTSYLAQISQDPGFSVIAGSATTPNTSTTFSAMAPNTTYFMQVSAVNKAGIQTTPPTFLGSGLTQASQPIAATPTNLQPTQVTANWTANGNPGGTLYKAQISPDPLFNSQVTSSSTFNTFVTFTSTNAGISPNTTYYMQVQAFNFDNLPTPFTPLQTVLTSANLPGALDPSSIQATQITANWSSGNNPQGTFYEADISMDSGFATSTPSITSGFSATFSNLTPNTSYYMRVAALNSQGHPGGYEPLPPALTLANTPTVAFPTVILSTQITANWGANNNPSGTQYKAQYSQDPTFNTGTNSILTMNTFATLSPLTPNTTYYMQVQAINFKNQPTGFQSLPTAETTPNPPDLASPTFSGVTNNQIQANWTTNGNPAQTPYQVILSTAPNPGTNGLAANVSSTTVNTSFVFSPLAPNTLYFVDVRVFNGNSSNNSIFAHLGSTVTLANQPGPGSASVVLSNQITVAWGANNNPSGTLYEAQITQDPTFNTGISISTTTSLTTTFPGLAPNTPYYMQVQAFNAGNAPTSFTTLGSTVTLEVPPGFASFSGLTNNQLQANWTTNGNPAQTPYQVILSTAPNPGTNGLATNVSSTTVNTSFVFSPLAPNTLYFVDVRVFNGANSSSFTPLGSTVTLANQPDPGSASIVLSNQITVVWGANNNPLNTLYQAEITQDPTFNSGISISTTTSLTITFPGLTPNTPYYMRVQAFNAGNTPTSFATLESTVTLANQPGSGSASVVLSNQITVVWGANNNPLSTLYQAEITQDPTFNTGVSISTTTSLTTTFPGLTPNTPYYMRVQAFNSGGSPTSFATLGSTVTLATPPGSAALSGVTNNQLQANWTTNGNPPQTPYQVILSTAPNPGTNGLATNVSSTTVNTSVVFSPLAPNTLYFVDVRVFNGANSSSFTPLGSTVTLANQPGTGSASVVLSNQITVVWGANNNPPTTPYEAQITQDPTFNTGISSITTANLTATFSGLTPNTLYYMRVQAFNSGGTPTDFATLGSTVTLPTPPGLASPSFSGVTNNQLQANWTTNGNPPLTTLYQVVLSTAANPGANGLITNSSSMTFNTSAVFPNLLPNTVYFVDVQVFNGNGANNSIFIHLGSTVTLANQPGMGSASVVLSTQITANWDSGGNPLGTLYQAQITQDPTFNTGISSITTANLVATFPGLTPNTLYYMRVQAFNSGGSPTSFATLGSTVTLANQPGTGSASVVLSNQITVVWGANNNPQRPRMMPRSPRTRPLTRGSLRSPRPTSLQRSRDLHRIPSTTCGSRRSILGGSPTSFATLGSTVTLANQPTSGILNVEATQITANWGSNNNPPNTPYRAQISTDFTFASSTPIPTTSLSATFAGLNPNTLYFIEVEALNSEGSPTSFALLGSTFTLANPPTPANPTNVQINQITANWGANSNPSTTQYTIQKSTDPAFGSFESDNTANLFFTFQGLLANTTYYMQVQATNGNGVPTSPFTALPPTVTRENPAAQPGGASYTNVSTSTLQANWATSGNPSDTQYNVILSTGPSPSTNEFTGNRSSTTLNTSVLFTELPVNTLYYADVNATTTGGPSAYTVLGPQSTNADQPTSSNPTNVQTNQITENWGGGGNPVNTSYFVELSDDPLFGSNVFTQFTSSLTYTFQPLSPNTTYYARVQAQNQQGSPTGFTGLPSAVTPPIFPGALGFNAITMNSLQANWTPNGNPSSTLYDAILSSGASPSTNHFSANQTMTTINTSVVFSGLLPNTPYYVDIAATNSSSTSTFTDEGPTWTLPNFPISSAPTNVLANQITANWGANSNPPGTFYQAQASSDQTFTINVFNVSTTSLSGTFRGLQSNTTSYMQVRAVNQNQTATSFIPLPSTTTLNNPAAPPGAAGLTNPTISQIQANWTANGNPVGTQYTAILSSAPSPSTNGLSSNKPFVGPATSTVFTGLLPNTVYYVDVQANNNNGSSPYTSLGSLPTLANPPAVGQPSNIGADQITANWGANGNPPETLYLVQIGLSTTSFVDTELTLETSFPFSGLSPNTIYYMQVQAINQAFQTTSFTILPSTTTVVGAPTGPVLTATQVTNSSVTWTWNSIPNATGYRVISENGVNVSGDLASGILQWQETGLAVNTADSRSVVAFNVSGASTSTLVTVYTLANQPTGLTAQTVGSNSITLAWNPNGNPDGTQYRAQIVQPGSTGISLTVTGTQAIFNDLQGATTYFLTVQAVSRAGIPAASGNTLTVATLPQTETTNQICPSSISSALSFNGPEGLFSLDIPQGAFPQCIQLTAQIPGAFPEAMSSGTPLQGIGVGILLSNDLALQPVIPITLTVPFTSAALGMNPRTSLVLARYDTIHNAWVMLPTTVNPTQNFVTAPATSLSLYQIMVALPVSGLSNINVYPNPFRPALGHTGVNFVALPTTSSIQIYTLTGEKVQDLTASATGTAFWDGRNQSGQNVASGVYFAVVKNGADKTILKVAVQR